MCKYVYQVSHSVKFVDVSNDLLNFPIARHSQAPITWEPDGDGYRADLAGVEVWIDSAAPNFRLPNGYDMATLFRLAAYTRMSESYHAHPVAEAQGKEGIEEANSFRTPNGYMSELYPYGDEREAGAETYAFALETCEKFRWLAGKVALAWPSLDAMLASLGMRTQDGRTHATLRERLALFAHMHVRFTRSGASYGPLIADYGLEGGVRVRLGADVMHGLFCPQAGYKRLYFSALPTGAPATFNLYGLLPLPSRSENRETLEYRLTTICERVGIYGQPRRQRERLMERAGKLGVALCWTNDDRTKLKLIVPPKEDAVESVDGSYVESFDELAVFEDATRPRRLTGDIGEDVKAVQAKAKTHELEHTPQDEDPAPAGLSRMEKLRQRVQARREAGAEVGEPEPDDWQSEPPERPWYQHYGFMFDPLAGLDQLTSAYEVRDRLRQIEDLLDMLDNADPDFTAQVYDARDRLEAMLDIAQDAA